MSVLISTVPENIKSSISDLDIDFKSGDLTLKDYCNKKWILLEKYIPDDVVNKVKEIQNNMTIQEVTEEKGYDELYKLLSPYIDERITLKSLENLEKLLPISNDKKCSKITDFFKKSDANKKRKVEDENDNENKRIKNELDTENVMKENVNCIKLIEDVKIKNEMCKICKQYLDSSELLLYNGHPNGAVEEFVALTDPKLLLFTGDESEVHTLDERPQNKITHFSVYDEAGHLCSFDSGLIEHNVLLYFSGYMKPVYEDNPDTEGGIATKDMGPINEWWVSGFDGGEKALLGFSTAYADYYLMEPSEEYRPLMKRVYEKIYMSKLVIEFLLKNGWESPSYEDLLNYLSAAVPPEHLSGSLNEENLLRYAQFVVDQVTSLDLSADDESLLITTPCMRSLVHLAGCIFTKRRSKKQTERKSVTKKNKTVWSKAVTTQLVREVFESFFPEQIDKANDVTIRRKRCGICDACQLSDCGKCSRCADMLKFGGTGRSKQCCIHRRCPIMAIENAEDSESEDKDDVIPAENNRTKKHRHSSKRVLHKVEWAGEPTNINGGRTYYNEALVGDIILHANDYVTLYSDEPGQPLIVAKICYMWNEPLQGAMFHSQLFIRGTETILGETCDPRELFIIDYCESCPLGSIIQKANVELRSLSHNWSMNGGLDSLPVRLEDDGKTFFYQKRYDEKTARFEDLSEEDLSCEFEKQSCTSCHNNYKKKRIDTPRFENGIVYWRNQEYKSGCGVYLRPGTFKFKTAQNIKVKKEDKVEVDENMYPEFYRKTSDNIKGSNQETIEPFCIGYIKEILVTKTSIIKLNVQKLYRPENTHKSEAGKQFDLNLLYWSEEQINVSFEDVSGLCYVACSDALEVSPEEWSQQGPNRFYFTQAYNSETQSFVQVEEKNKLIGCIGKGKGFGKGKSKQSSNVCPNVPENWFSLQRPLRTMDVFAGCGGLSEGLHRCGVAESKWAIEKEQAAANAYRLNNPDTIVYTQDCNELLNLVMSGETHSKNGQPLPKKGDIELLCGGPPCQGFSGMNRFNAGQYSLFKNSLVASYLSYCDYYRPRYFILENVRNFVSFKRSMVLKLTLNALLSMGYQCTFGILQAGNYGIPQTRRRLIIFAAAPGEVLPRYPEATNVFNRRACQLSAAIDDFRYDTGSYWTDSAPYRTITVRDAMSDLPEIKNGANVSEQPYNSEPLSHFQRQMRNPDQSLVRDHICKDMAPIVEARMSYIPTASGSDWRDLPNIVVRLSDGTHTVKLKYAYYDKKNKLRGVCRCVKGKNSCDFDARQDNTLIPWCLPHTANRHNNWAGLYGRLEWDGFFSTTVTNPEPMGKQGRVLHPTQNRVVSVRECARSQGFSDSFRFYGTILDKYRQIGNAVPPPMGAAIGRELIRAIVQKERLKSN